MQHQNTMRVHILRICSSKSKRTDDPEELKKFEVLEIPQEISPFFFVAQIVQKERNAKCNIPPQRFSLYPPQDTLDGTSPSSGIARAKLTWNRTCYRNPSSNCMQLIRSNPFDE